MRPGTPRDLRIDAVPGRTDFQVKVSLLVTTHRSRNSRRSSEINRDDIFSYGVRYRGA
jgi:hypothetical protein